MKTVALDRRRFGDWSCPRAVRCVQKGRWAHLHALAQRVEASEREVWIIGSRNTRLSLLGTGAFLTPCCLRPL